MPAVFEILGLSIQEEFGDMPLVVLPAAGGGGQNGRVGLNLQVSLRRRCW